MVEEINKDLNSGDVAWAAIVPDGPQINRTSGGKHQNLWLDLNAVRFCEMQTREKTSRTKARLPVNESWKISDLDGSVITLEIIRSLISAMRYFLDSHPLDVCPAPNDA